MSKYLNEDGTFNHGKWQRVLNESVPEGKTIDPDVYNYTDYSNTTLKSDIDQKWKALSDMTYDMEQWIEASYQANGKEAMEGIEDALEGLLKWVKNTKRDSKNDPFYKSDSYLD